MIQTGIQNAILLVLILNLVLPGPKQTDNKLLSVTSSFQGVSTCICASTLGRSGTSCSNVNSGANNFICVKANAVALDLKRKNQIQFFLMAEIMSGIVQKYLE